jgi:hypothetical protein
MISAAAEEGLLSGHLRFAWLISARIVAGSYWVCWNVGECSRDTLKSVIYKSFFQKEVYMHRVEEDDRIACPELLPS